jgi:hypothetical protein
MKTLAIAALFAFLASGAALADNGKRCGPTGQFYGYGSTGILSMPCWAIEAHSGGDANGSTASP